MNQSYLAKVAKALQSGRRFSDSAPSYLDHITDKIDTMSYNNTTERQREEQQKIDAYLKAYGDKPEVIEKLLELYHMNNWKSPQAAKAWY